MRQLALQLQARSSAKLLVWIGLVVLWGIATYACLTLLDVYILKFVRSNFEEKGLIREIAFYLSRLAGTTFWVITIPLIYLMPNYITPWWRRLRGNVEPVCIKLRYHLLALELTLISLGGGLIANISKYLIGRTRPYEYLNRGINEFLGPVGIRNSDSFPSGHALQAWGVAFVLARAFPQFRAAFFLLALVVSLTRVVLFRHWVSDLVASVGIAYILAKLLHRLVYSKNPLRYSEPSKHQPKTLESTH